MIEAVELLGSGTLPDVYSPSLTAYFWGPPESNSQTVITLGYEAEQMEFLFDSFAIAARAPCKYCTGWRQSYPIGIGRGLRRPLAEVWPDLRQYFGRKSYLLGQRAGS